MRRPSPFRLPRWVDLLTSIVRPVCFSFALMGSPRCAPVRRDSEQALRSSPVRAASCTHSTPWSTARRSHHRQCRAVRPPCTMTSPRALCCTTSRPQRARNTRRLRSVSPLRFAPRKNHASS
ncbi:hypothetical protein FB451DRAFT_1569802 [Mycena latifolia]|nr:hypothetical protein FB451DRAFT_1569802 [Mycena latifolia]